MMKEKEDKEENQSTEVKPKVKTMKACIVSMEYVVKNKDGTPKLPPMDENYRDAEKLKHLLTKTLGWDQEDVLTFKDEMFCINNIYEQI
jgi:hypothetical protein